MRFITSVIEPVRQQQQNHGFTTPGVKTPGLFSKTWFRPFALHHCSLISRPNKSWEYFFYWRIKWSYYRVGYNLQGKGKLMILLWALQEEPKGPHPRRIQLDRLGLNFYNNKILLWYKTKNSPNSCLKLCPSKELPNLSFEPWLWKTLRFFKCSWSSRLCKRAESFNLR